jgi:hypothetical protein
MGWGGHSNYSGDGTQTLHYNFLAWAKCATEDEIMDQEWLKYRKTVIPKDKIPIFQKNIKKVIKKMPKSKYWNESNAIDWQMLLALFVDNKLPVPRVIFEKGLDATNYLMGEHSDDFENPGARRRCLRVFAEKAKKLQIIKKN